MLQFQRNNHHTQHHSIYQLIACLLLFISALSSALDQPRPRVIVSTDIGGTDPDDFQSMVHLLLYADTLDLKGLISSPFGAGRKSDILRVIDKYAADFKRLRAHSKYYPSPKQLRKMSKQGETRIAPYQGFRQATEGSNWIIQQARTKDPRPLIILVWGGIEDLAQALHDAPEILPKLRVYWIGGPNKKWSPDAYQYIADHHPKLWIIESNASYRGWFVGGDQTGHWGNKTFANAHIAGRGALGKFFMTQLGGEIKMGDTPSVAWALHKNPEDPTQAGWGGKYTRAWARPYKRFNRLTTTDDQIEEFGVLELALTTHTAKENQAFAAMHIGNQILTGHFIGEQVHFRFSPKTTGRFDYVIESSDPALNRKQGSLVAIATRPGQLADAKWPNWWVDHPSPEYKEGPHIGAKTVNQWRKAFLGDFAKRMTRL